MDARTQPPALRTGSRLPVITLTSVASGRPVSLREPAAGAPAILALPPRPERFAEYARTFASKRQGYTYWAGRPIVIISGDLDNATKTAAEIGLADTAEGQIGETTVLIDAAGSLRRKWGLADEEAAVIVADRWGEVYSVARASDPDDLPGTGAVDEWLRFIATQCPECGVIDEPGLGEWRAD
ncbi:MAG TPA: hypothetical protein VNZ57_06125 [Longimicrobiales bacterium]|nr:hypothetical protein [Longimicrobiales bacterium]